MSAIVFDGEAFASQRELVLREKVSRLEKKPRLFVMVFGEDEAGQIYAGLKQQAAERIGVGFERVNLSVTDSMEKIQQVIREANLRGEVTGVMVQKPMKSLWERQFPIFNSQFSNYLQWWEAVTSAIEPDKDVDCLTRINLEAVYAGRSDLLPATAKACLEILEDSVMVRKPVSSSGYGYEAQYPNRNGHRNLNQLSVGIVGRSELVGRPLAAKLEQLGTQVKLLGSGDDLVRELSECDVVVSATGRRGLITGEMVKEGAVVIDVGAPGADVDFASVSQKAGFITPVPGGVGPVTVVSLMENVVG